MFNKVRNYKRLLNFIKIRNKKNIIRMIRVSKEALNDNQNLININVWHLRDV